MIALVCSDHEIEIIAPVVKVRVYSFMSLYILSFYLMIAANKWKHYLGMYGDSLLVRVEDSTFEISIR